MGMESLAEQIRRRAGQSPRLGYTVKFALAEDGVGCNVAAGEIFLESAAYEVAVLPSIKRLGLGQTQPLP